MSRSPLARKFTLLIVALSTAITFLTTVFQLILEYREELGDLQRALDTIEKTHASSIGYSMWTFDEDGIQIIIENILKIRDIEYIEVVIDEKHKWQGGTRSSRKIVDRNIAVVYNNGHKNVSLGTLRIVGSLDNVYGRIIDKTFIILGSNGFKTFFVSLFILFLFQRLVARHLTDLSNYATEVASGSLSVPFVLKRKKRRSSELDELDRAVSAINRMRENLMAEVEKLRKTEKELVLTRVSVETVSDSVFWLSSNGRIIDVNNAACESLGYSRDELLQLTVQDLDAQYKKGIWEQHFLELRKAGTLLFESYHRRKGGGTFPVEMVANYILHGDAEFNCSIARNISERKKHEEEKQKLSSQLQQAQKMEAIGTLAGGIAHDFNNILSVILGYVELIQEDVQPDEEVEEKLDTVLSATLRAKDLVKQILVFSRQESPELSAVDPGQIVQESLKMLRHSLPSTIEIVGNIDPKMRRIFADSTQVNQIVMNLCTNAYHAMEETGGRLEVAVRERRLSREDTAGNPSISPGFFIELTVSDNGPGIPPENLHKIFDPYFTTKETGKGTGMGLSIIQGIVKSYGGFISVTRSQPSGTTFSVYLPIIEGEARLATSGVESKISTGSERILFVDDEEILVKMGGTLLQRLGYEVTLSNDSVEALTIFKSKPNCFDVIITDQTMPKMTGTQLAAEIISVRPDIPIILCTGYSSVVSEAEAKSMGIQEFALKPLTRNDIAHLIRKVLGKSNQDLRPG